MSPIEASNEQVQYWTNKLSLPPIPASWDAASAQEQTNLAQGKLENFVATTQAQEDSRYETPATKEDA